MILYPFLRDVVNSCMKSTTGMWIFHNWRTTAPLHRAVMMCGHSIESQLVWDKDWIGPGGSKGLRPSYELISLICSDGFSITDRGIYDIQKFPWSTAKPNHPAEKPLKLLNWLINISNGKAILDPFLGSGTTAVAAKQLGRKYIGIEIEEKYCDIARQRLAQEILI